MPWTLYPAPGLPLVFEDQAGGLKRSKGMVIFNNELLLERWDKVVTMQSGYNFK